MSMINYFKNEGSYINICFSSEVRTLSPSPGMDFSSQVYFFQEEEVYTLIGYKCVKLVLPDLYDFHSLKRYTTCKPRTTNHPVEKPTSILGY